MFGSLSWIRESPLTTLNPKIKNTFYLYVFYALFISITRHIFYLSSDDYLFHTFIILHVFSSKLDHFILSRYSKLCEILVRVSYRTVEANPGNRLHPLLRLSGRKTARKGQFHRKCYTHVCWREYGNTDFYLRKSYDGCWVRARKFTYIFLSAGNFSCVRWIFIYSGTTVNWWSLPRGSDESRV